MSATTLPEKRGDQARRSGSSGASPETPCVADERMERPAPGAAAESATEESDVVG